MRRREFIAGLGGMAAGLQTAGTSAQLRRSRPLIGWLGGSSRQVGARNHGAFLQGLKEHGHENGKAVDLVELWANGDTALLSSLAREIVARDPDVVLSASGAGNVALMRASASIPIVGALTVDPLKLGLAISYNKPGRNFTGVLLTIDGLPAKQAEILLKLLPRATVFGVLLNPDNPTHPAMLREIEGALTGKAIRIVKTEARRREELAECFVKMQEERANGFLVLTDNLFFTAATDVVELAISRRLPGIQDRREHVQQGGLISYGIAIPENFRRAAYFADRILHGVKPGDLPIELPTKVELAINLKSAKALGIEVPSELLFTADEVIE